MKAVCQELLLFLVKTKQLKSLTANELCRVYLLDFALVHQNKEVNLSLILQNVQNIL